MPPGPALRDWGPKGLFLGYDFHLTPEGHKTLEINTNASKALLNSLLRQAEHSSDEVSNLYDLDAADDFTRRVTAVFSMEWGLQ